MRGVDIECVGIYRKGCGIGSLHDDTASHFKHLICGVAEPDYLMGLEVLDYLSHEDAVNIFLAGKEFRAVAADRFKSLHITVFGIGLIDVYSTGRDAVVLHQ